MPFGATPSRWCVCHFTTSAECAKTNYTIWAGEFAAVPGLPQAWLGVQHFDEFIFMDWA
jgi:hypothetical protein